MKIFGTSRSRMQQPIAACTRTQTLTKTLPLCYLHLTPTRAQDAHECGRCYTFHASLQAIYVHNCADIKKTFKVMLLYA